MRATLQSFIVEELGVIYDSFNIAGSFQSGLFKAIF